MPIRLDTDLTARAYFDADAKQCFFDSGLDGNAVQILNQQGGGALKIRLQPTGDVGGADVYTITAGGANSQDVTEIRGFYLEFPAAVTVSVNGGTALPMSPVGATGLCRYWLEGGPFTSIVITNPGSTAVEGRGLVFGDPTA